MSAADVIIPLLPCLLVLGMAGIISVAVAVLHAAAGWFSRRKE